MKHVRQLCAVAVLMFVLASSAFAGDIHCGDVPTPPDPPAMMGNMECGFMGTAENTFVDPATELTLNILQSVLSLF